MYEVDLFIEAIINAMLTAGDLSLAFLALCPIVAIAWAHVPATANKAIRVASAPLPAIEQDTHRGACLAYMAEQRKEMELEKRIEQTIARLSSARVAEVGEWVEAQEDWAWNGLVIVTDECVLLTASELETLPDGMSENDVLELLALVSAGMVVLPELGEEDGEVFGPEYWWDDQEKYGVDEDGTIYYIE